MLDALKSEDSSRTVVAVIVGGLLAMTCLVGGGIVAFVTIFSGDCPWGAELIESTSNGTLTERYCQTQNDQGSFVKHGLYEEWDEDGNKLQETEYRDGEKHGTHIEWDPDGAKLVEAEYREGDKHGTTIEWNEDGRKISEIEYADGEKDGTAIRWLDGIKYEEISHQEGDRHGEAEFFYDEGSQRATAEYRDGRLHGEMVGWYHPNEVDSDGDNKLVEATYDEGLLEGPARLYPLTSDGIELELTFENDRLVEPSSLTSPSHEFDFAGTQNLLRGDGLERRVRLLAIPIAACSPEYERWFFADDWQLSAHCRAVLDIAFEDDDEAHDGIRKLLFELDFEDPEDAEAFGGSDPMDDTGSDTGTARPSGDGSGDEAVYSEPSLEPAEPDEPSIDPAEPVDEPSLDPAPSQPVDEPSLEPADDGDDGADSDDIEIEGNPFEGGGF